MKFGLGWTPNESSETLIKCAREAESFSFNYLWLWEEPVSKNVFVAASIIAANTKKIHVGPTAISPYYRNPVIIGSSMLTLDEISGGRAIVGVATGDYRVAEGRLGIKLERPVVRLRETIQALKKMFSEEKTRFDGETVRFETIKFGWVKKNRKIPVYASIVGPKMLEMAGQVADGVMMVHPPIEYMDYAIAQIRKGADKAGRDFKEIDVGVHLEIFPHEDYDRALSIAAKSYTQLGYITYLPILWEKAGFSESEIELVRKDFFNLPPEVVNKIAEKFSIIGTFEDCIKKIKQYESKGVKQIQLTPVVGDIQELFYARMWRGTFNLIDGIRTLAKEIVPSFLP